MIRIPIGLGLLALCLGACGSSAGNSIGLGEVGSGDVDTTRERQEGAAARSFLSMIPEAHERLAYAGTRKVRMSYEIQGQSRELVYEESVVSDGQGHFSLTPGDVLVPSMRESDKQLFAIDQTRRAGVFFRHRDFRVRDLQLFLRNYQIEDTGIEVEVAGVPCVQLDVRRRSDARRTHRAAIDPKTGLVMRYEEFDASGRSIASVEFVSFTLNPDVKDLDPKSGASAGTPFRLQDSAQALGFETRAPTLVPSGYRLLKTEKVIEQSEPDLPHVWARLTYGDGLEQIFFLYTKSVGSAASAEAERDEYKVVKVFQAGPLVVAQHSFAGEQAIVIGKIGETPLLEMLQSALE